MSHQDTTPHSLMLARYLPYIGAATVTIAIVVNLAYIFLPDSEFRRLYTHRTDLLLGIPTLCTAICMLLFWRRVDRQKRWRSVAYWLIAAVLWTGVLIHLTVQVVQSNAWIWDILKPWHSAAVLLPFYVFMLWFFLTIKVRPLESGSQRLEVRT